MYKNFFLWFGFFFYLFISNLILNIMIYNTTFSRWLLFLASLGSQIEGFVGKAVGPRGSCACSISTFPVVSGRCGLGSFAVAPGLGATDSDPPPDLGSVAGSLARVLRRVLHFLSGIFVSSPRSSGCYGRARSSSRLGAPDIMPGPRI